MNGDLCHDLLFKDVKPKLAFADNQKSFDEWKKEIKEKLISLLGYERIAENQCPLNITVERKEEKDGYTLIRFTFESEVGAVVPCYLLIPKTGKEKYPVAIVLHGHSTGFHNAIGEIKTPYDKPFHPVQQFALQAVENGFIALAIEQRAMGERRSIRSYGKDNVFHQRPHMCAHTALTAIALGRTVIGERVWDVSKAIDALSAFPECDTEHIVITGNSGGGTTSYYAACLEERIKLCVPSCAFCSYKGSIFDIEHCACNYIPDAANWFEMADLSVLIAPRDLVIVAGKKDPIFPIECVREDFETVKRIFDKGGAKDRCALIETEKDHYWCSDVIWPKIVEKAKELKFF